MTGGSRRTRWTSRTFHKGADGSPSRAFQALLSAIPYLTLARVLTGLGLWLVLSTTAPEDEPSLELADQTTFVAADGTMIFDLAIDPGDAVDPVLSLVVYGTVDAEDDLDGPLPQVLNRLAARPLGQLEEQPDGTRRLAVPIRSGQAFDDVVRMKLPSAGVYPIQIELRTTEGPIATALTHIVRLEETGPGEGEADDRAGPADRVGRPVAQEIAVVVSVSADGLSLDDATALFNDHPDTPLTVLIDAETVDRLQTDRAARTELALALRGRPVLVTPDPELDPSALAEIDQVRLFEELTSATTQTVTALGLTPATALHLLDTRPTEDGLAALDAVGVRSILNVGGRSRDVGAFRTENRTIRMIAADGELSALVDGDGGAHRANRLLTRLTLRNQGDPKPVVLAPAEPDPTTVDSLLRAMVDGPTKPVLVTDIWRATSDGQSGWLTASERPSQDLRPVADLLWRVQQKLATYEEFNVDTDAIAVGGTGEAEEIRRGITTALGTGSTPERRREILDSLETTLNQNLGVIELHDGQPVTLAARSAPIPVVVESSADGPRKVMLRLRSDKVRSIDDTRIIEIPPGTTSINVELETRSLGVSPLEVSMWTPDGSTMLASTRFQVRSTAIPGLGLLVTGGAVLLLIGWWVLDARARRRETAPTG
ncbi:MAG: DUF6049 family protein [Actinomycetota bacterium]